MVHNATKRANHFDVTLAGRHMQLACLSPSTAERVLRLRTR